MKRNDKKLLMVSVTCYYSWLFLLYYSIAPIFLNILLFFSELFLTEASHVRMLKVLYKLFYKRLQSSQMLKPDEINLLFPNIKELLDIHTEINKEMRRIRKEDPLVRQIGDMLLDTFTGKFNISV